MLSVPKMKFHSILVLIVVVGAFFVPLAFGDGEVNAPNGEGPNSIESYVREYLVVVGRLMKFRSLVKKEEEATPGGIITMENLGETAKSALEKAKDCFKESSQTLTEFLKVIYGKIRESVHTDATDDQPQDPPAEAGSDVASGWNIAGAMKEVTQTFATFRKILEDPDVKNELIQVEDKVIEAVNTSIKCFFDAFKELLGADVWPKVLSLWEQTKTE